MSNLSRRHFLFGTLLAGAIPRAGYGSSPSLKFLGYQSPNEKLNIAGIGAGGRALQVLNGCVTENIVALADVDWARGADGFARFPGATKYKDFRRMLDQQGKEIDAVVVATPDHTHATCAIPCMQLGKGVYVEKPLTRTPWEARLLTQAAQRYKVATQMGNQGYSHEATRVAAEIIWSGEIGDVTEVHSFRGRASWPEGMQTMPATERVPDTLDWDLWIGPAAFRPYTSGDEAYRKEYPNQFGFYLPFNWRGFYDFGSTLIGDWGIHQLGPANLALRLGSPTSVECVTRGDGSSPYTFPRGGIVIKWEFAARENMPPVTVYWSHTGDMYTPQGMTVEEMRAIPGTGPTIDTGPAEGRGRGLGGGREGRAGQAAPGAPGQPGAQPGRGRGRGGQPGSGYNTVYVGTKGYLGTGGRGESVGLIPGSRWAEYKLPPRMLTRSPGHQRDWVRACKGGEPACSNFSVAGPYTEWMVLGAVATRVNGKLLWDPKKMEFTNSKEANRYVKPMFRKGWEVKPIT
jgi:Oxidoreductase family, NAD-binding Rossmann fold/Oxidoreductase family, C-terminal alpha/beta domain